MTEVRKTTSSGFRTLLAFVATGALAACVQDDAADYCKNHYEFHDLHAEGLAYLDMEFTTQGALHAELRLPQLALENEDGQSALLQSLQDPASVYGIQSGTACAAASVERQRGDAGWQFNYESRCGPDNRVGQVDVRVLDLLPALDEVEVSVTTPATAKRFAISRRCEAAIFRLDRLKAR